MLTFILTLFVTAFWNMVLKIQTWCPKEDEISIY